MTQTSDAQERDAAARTSADEPATGDPYGWQEVPPQATPTAATPPARVDAEDTLSAHPTDAEPRDGRPAERSRTWAMLAHLAAVAVFMVPVFGNVIGPLIVWLALRNEDPFVDRHGREAVNFQITVALVLLVIGGLTAFLSAGVAFGLFFVFPLLPLLWVALALVAAGAIALTVLAAVKAYHGEPYRYPFTIRFVQESQQGERVTSPARSDPTGSWTSIPRDEPRRAGPDAVEQGEGSHGQTTKRPTAEGIDDPPRGPAGP